DQQRTTKAYTVTIRGVLSIVTMTLPNGSVGTAYSQTLASSGGTVPLVWSVVDGQLPTGLQLAGATGVISGTPSAAGMFDFTVQVIDASNRSARQRYTVTIIGPPRILTQTLPAGTLNAAYSAALEATGGETPYAWSASGLPAGLAID